MEKFANTYSVRSPEIGPQYRLRRECVGFYFQEAFAEFCAAKKMAGYDMARIGLTWLITDAQIEYFESDMPFWREKVETSVEAAEISALFFNAVFEMHCGGALAASGKYRALIADSNTRRPKKFSDFAERFPNAENRKIEIEKFEIKGEKIAEVSQKVRLPDLDFNRHLNNVRYLPRAIESIPENVREQKILRKSLVKFVKEARLGDEIISETFASAENEYCHKLTRAQDGAVLCLAKTLWQ
ncbi:MAG: hypothetical protein IKO42_05595 [Opitutales bacterium]|nr:hypothetical protein [Opitutales bacterium]